MCVCVCVSVCVCVCALHYPVVHGFDVVIRSLDPPSEVVCEHVDIYVRVCMHTFCIKPIQIHVWEISTVGSVVLFPVSQL